MPPSTAGQNLIGIKAKSTKDYKQMFVFLLTTAKRYDIIQEYRRKSACTLLPYIEFRYGVLPLQEEGRITGWRRGVVCSEVAARKECAAGNNPSRLKDEPRQGFYKHTLF